MIGQEAKSIWRVERAVQVTKIVGMAGAAVVGSLLFMGKPAKALSSESAPKCGIADWPYAYAGIEGRNQAHEISATVTEMRSPRVIDGHVAGWVGLRGYSNQSAESISLQVGIERTNDQTDGRVEENSHVYVEYLKNGNKMLPDKSYGTIGVNVPNRLHVSIKETSDSRWAVYINGVRQKQLTIPGSHNNMSPEVEGESWGSTTQACNSYEYGFDNIRVDGLSKPASHAFDTGILGVDHGYAISHKSATGFVARSIRR
jgi:hypothetical protein